MKRKLIKQGLGGYTIYLPKKWVEEFGLKGSSEVNVDRWDSNLVISSKKLEKIPQSEIKFLPQKYSSPLAVNIYKDKVAIILWSKENPIAIVIKNKEITEGYKKHFELMWNVARK